MVKNKFNFSQIKTLVLSNKKASLGGALFLVVLSFFLFHSSSPTNVTIDEVKRVDLTKSVRATGQVISKTDLALSFNKASVVRSVKVAVGDAVKAGQILANLDQGTALAALTQAKGALLGAQAKYDKTVEGSSNEEIALAEVSLKNAQTDLVNVKATNDTLVANAYRALLNSSVSAYSVSTNSNQTPPVITGTYVLDKEGDINITTQSGGGNNYFVAGGLVNASGSISATTPQPIGNSGLFIQFPVTTTDNWVISIPNKKAANYLTNYNAYKNAQDNETAALASAQALVDQKQAELNLKKAAARSADLDIAQADVLSAQGSLQAAQAAYEDTIIRAPADGTITKVDIKYGELSVAGKSVINLEDVSNLYIEALINESNIAYLKLGQSVSITFDAFGGDKKFTGVIAEINPSADTTDGVVNYKIKVSINEKDATIRPGMNANIDVLAGEAKGVLAIPYVAITKKDGKSFINLITNEKKSTYKEVEVQTGFIGDNNLVEITSGLNANDKIALVKS